MILGFVTCALGIRAQLKGLLWSKLILFSIMFSADVEIPLWLERHDPGGF